MQIISICDIESSAFRNNFNPTLNLCKTTNITAAESNAKLTQKVQLKIEPG